MTSEKLLKMRQFLKADCSQEVELFLDRQRPLSSACNYDMQHILDNPDGHGMNEVPLSAKRRDGDGPSAPPSSVRTGMRSNPTTSPTSGSRAPSPQTMALLNWNTKENLNSLLIYGIIFLSMYLFFPLKQAFSKRKKSKSRSVGIPRVAGFKLQK